MSALIEEIKASLLKLVGVGVELLPGFIFGAVILLVTRYVANLAQRITERMTHRIIRSESLKVLLARTSFIATWIAGILTASVLAFPELRLGDIIGLLGLSSVAIGFAFQDIFKNFLAGILLLIREPFRLHDQIIVNGFEGTVEGIDLRTTKIRTYQGERILVPNSIVFTSPVQVLTAFPYRRTDLAVGVDYNSPLPKVTQILMDTLEKIDGVLDKPGTEIDVVSFGDSSIDLMVRYWTKPQMKQVRFVKTQVMMAIKQAFDQQDIKIPYPIRTLYLFDQEKHTDYFANSASESD